MSRPMWHKPGFLLGVAAGASLLAAVACGSPSTPTPEPTPTTPPPTATATATATVKPATPTATVAPGGTPSVVAAPTSTATPTPSPIPSVQPKRGGIIRQSGTQDPPSFDPHNNTSSTHNVHNAKLYSSLLWNPVNDQIVPDAAESYSISADGKEWTFKLRPNVKFQSGYSPAYARDGTAMTAQDVKYSLLKMMGLTDGVISPRSGWMKEFVDIDRTDNGVEIVDNLTIKLHLIQPFPGLANILILGFSGIIPDKVTSEMMAKRPYGSGAFKVDLSKSQRGAVWYYDRNSNYFKAGLPYIDGWQHINMDGTAIIQAAFLTGKLDLSSGNPTLDNKANYEQRVKSGQIYMLPYSSGCRPQVLNMNSTKPPFNDKRLRDAVNLTFDRVAYAQVVHNGYAEPTLLLDTGRLGHTVAEINQLPGWRQPHDADLAAAKKTVSELYPKGLDVPMIVRNESTYQTEGEFIAGELRKIGINVTISIFDANIINDKASKLDYTLWSYYFCQTTGGPEELFGSYFITGGSRNWFGYSDPKIDAGYHDLAATVDPVLRKQKSQAMEKIVLDSNIMATLPVQTSNRIHYNYVKDVPLTITFYTWEKDELIWRSDV